MDPNIHQRYTPEIHQQMMALFGIPKGSEQALDGFESFIYEFKAGSTPYVLRVGHESRRSLNRLLAEADFLTYLHQNGLQVACPILSPQKNYAELVPDGAGEHFIGIAFNYAPGHPAKSQEWQPALFSSMGRFMGRLHRLSKSYRPSQPEFIRPHWYEDLLNYAEKYLPASQQDIINMFNAHVQKLRTLPTPPDQYHLVHQDFHGGNFFVENGKITAFDFDDIVHGPAAYDVAMALYYALPPYWELSAEEIAEAKIFWQCFMQGYEEENHLPPEWVATIPDFLKLREIDFYIAVHRSFDLEQLDITREDLEGSERYVARFMRRRREHILNHIPVAPFDLTLSVA